MDEVGPAPRSNQHTMVRLSSSTDAHGDQSSIRWLLEEGGKYETILYILIIPLI